VGVVTVSRQFGAGGLRVAAALSEALGYRLVDRELVEQAAARLGMDPELAAERDERVPALIEEVGLALAAGSPELGLVAEGPDDRSLAEAVRAVIASLAEAGGYVILGRGGQAVLRGRSDACHLSLVGDLRDRAARVAGWRGIPERDAVEQAERTDAERAGYVRRFHGVDISDPLLYDAVLNTTLLGIDGAVHAAVAVARRLSP
jgi:cytidylate kinase